MIIIHLSSDDIDMTRPSNHHTAWPLAPICVTAMNLKQFKSIYSSCGCMLKGLMFSEQVICQVDLPHNRLFMLYATLESRLSWSCFTGGRADSHVAFTIIVSVLHTSSVQTRGVHRNQIFDANLL